MNKAQTGSDCMTYIVGKNASLTGHVLVGHNEDDTGYISVRHGYVPHAKWENGTLIPAENGRIQVPQAEETFGYYITQFRSAEGGLPAADSFLNENGVCVVSDSSCGSKDYDEAETHPDGGICYELRRIIAERSKSARHGLGIALDLLKTYGYASPGRIYTIADSEEAFMLQIVYGKRYVAARVPDDCIVIMPNHYTFHTLSDVPEMYWSDDIITHAMETGRYTPAVPGDYSDFDFARAYQNDGYYRSEVNTLRQKYGTQILTGREFDAEKTGYPFCVKADFKVGREEIMRALSTHYEGTCHDKRCLNGHSPHFFTGVRRVCVGSTLESAVYELAPVPWQTTVWTAFGRPCSLPYIPVHPLCGAVKAIDAMDNPAHDVLTHHEPRPGSICRRNDGWQQFKDFENSLEQVYSKEIESVSNLKSSLLRDFGFEDSGNHSLVKTLDEKAGREFLHSRDEKNAAYTLQILSSVRAKLFDTIQVNDISVNANDAEFTVSFCPRAPLNEDSVSLWAGRCCLDTGSAKAVPGSFINDNESVTCRFAFEKPVFEGVGPGRYEFFISGQTHDGTPLVGMAVATVK